MADSAIRRYESGRANPKSGTIAKIAAALEVNIFELIDKEDFISQKNKLKEFLTPERKKEREEIEEWIMSHEQEVIAVQLRDILNTYNELNDTGRKMSVKRIEELRYSDIMTDSQQDDIYFDRIKKKIKNGEKLAPAEIE